MKHHLKGNALPAIVLKERHGRVTYAYDNEPKRLHTSYRAYLQQQENWLVSVTLPLPS